MKRLLLLFLCLLSAVLVRGQQLTYEFDYDHAGNRIRRTVIIINHKDAGQNDKDEPGSPLIDMMNGGAAMAIFPNPTKESVRFELSGSDRIGDYVLSDISGRVVTRGRCEDPSLTLDLSRQKDGIYLLEILIDKKPHVYKVIKQ